MRQVCKFLRFKERHASSRKISKRCIASLAFQCQPSIRHGWQHRGKLQAIAQRLCSAYKSRCLPGTCIACFDVRCPAAKAFQCLPRQLQQRGIHGFLLCQPEVEHLLDGPGCLAKFMQSHHARTALERMKAAAQRSLFAQVVRLRAQHLRCSLAMEHNLAHLFQKNIQQLIVQNWLKNRRTGYRSKSSAVQPGCGSDFRCIQWLSRLFLDSKIRHWQKVLAKQLLRQCFVERLCHVRCCFCFFYFFYFF